MYPQCTQLLMLNNQKNPKGASSSQNPPLNQDFFLNMFASFTANIDKKIESVIDKKLGKQEQLETKKDDVDDVLSAFYNLRLGYFGEIKQGKHFFYRVLDHCPGSGIDSRLSHR